jgi:excinuclease ABC subunit A
VGTITEIYDYLRLLYASIGTPHCPNCGRPIARQTADQIVQRILELGRGERVTVMAPIVRGRKGEFKELLDQLDQQGFRARVDGELRDLSEPVLLDRRKNHTIEAVVDRILLKIPAPTRPRFPPASPRWKSASTWPSPRLCNWPTAWCWWPLPGGEEQLFSSSMACPDCGLDVPKLEPRSFSFNSAFGACPECHGLGSLYDLDPAKVITDWSKPLLDGGSAPAPPRNICSSSFIWPPTATRSTSRRPSRICPRASSTFWSTARPKAKARAPAFTAFSPSCATASKRRAAIPIASR